MLTAYSVIFVVHANQKERPKEFHFSAPPEVGKVYAMENPFTGLPTTFVKVAEVQRITNTVLVYIVDKSHKPVGYITFIRTRVHFMIGMDLIVAFLPTKRKAYRILDDERSVKIGDKTYTQISSFFSASVDCIVTVLRLREPQDKPRLICKIENWEILQ